MNWITLKLMRYQLKKARKQHSYQEDTILTRAYNDMVKSYKSAIMFLEANSNN